MGKRGVRYLALQALSALEKRRGYSAPILSGILAKNPLTSQDRRLLTHIFYGVLQRRSTLDYCIDTLSKRGIEGMDPLLKGIVRIGCYQLLYLDGVPSYAAIDETVRLTYLHGRRGWAPFVNALLRRLDREGITLPSGEGLQDLVVRYSHPSWIIELFLHMYSLEKTQALLAANNRIPPLGLRVNTLKCKKEDLLLKLEREGVEARPFHGIPDAILAQGLAPLSQLPSFNSGSFYVQGLAAMTASHLLGGEEGEEILDLCAGVGGKATHLAQLTRDRARIVALDIHQHRLNLLEENCDRLGLDSIESICCDALEYHPGTLFHRVLVDPPCSDLGLLARRPEIRWFKREEDLSSLSALQRRLLEKGASLVKRGGYLLYSTCTLSRVENGLVVEDFLKDHRGFCLLHGEEILKERGVDFLPEMPRSRRGFLEYLPDQEGSEGFFLALLRRS